MNSSLNTELNAAMTISVFRMKKNILEELSETFKNKTSIIKRYFLFKFNDHSLI